MDLLNLPSLPVMHFCTHWSGATASFACGRKGPPGTLGRPVTSWIGDAGLEHRIAQTVSEVDCWDCLTAITKRAPA